MAAIRISVLLAFALFVSACIDTSIFDLSDKSYVFITNSTDEPVTVSLSADGSDAGANAWALEKTTIAPYATEQVLRVERANPLAVNLTLELTSNSLGTVELLQRFSKGATTHSYGYSVDGQNSLYSDTNLHAKTDTNSDTKISVKGKNKALNTDVYYAITSLRSAHIPSADALSVVTWNIWGLSGIAESIPERFNLIPLYLDGYDVILFQEAFDAQRVQLFNALSGEYPYQTDVLNGPENKLYDGGVVILSRYPIVSEAYYTYPDCTGSDCFAEKGIVYAQVIKNGKAFHLFNTHTASFDTSEARSLRQTQFQQMLNFAKAQNIPTDETVVFAGDLNVNKRIFQSDYDSMLAKLKASEPTYAGYTDATLDTRVNVFAQNAFSGAPHPEYIDYIFVSNDWKSSNGVTNTVVVNRTANEALWEKWDLSDHFTVEAQID